MAHPQMTHAVDITDTFARKVKALQQHTSQTAHLGDGLETMLRGWSTALAANARSRAGAPRRGVRRQPVAVTSAARATP